MRRNDRVGLSIIGRDGKLSQQTKWKSELTASWVVHSSSRLLGFRLGVGGPNFSVTLAPSFFLSYSFKQASKRASSSSASECHSFGSWKNFFLLFVTKVSSLSFSFFYGRNKELWALCLFTTQGRGWRHLQVDDDVYWLASLLTN